MPDGFSAEPADNQAFIKHKSPSDAFSMVFELFAPEAYRPEPGIAESAFVDESAQLGKDVHIGANAVIMANVELGNGCIVEAGSYVGPGVVMGKGCRLHPNVTVRENSIFADAVFIHSGTVIGCDGFGYIPGEDGHKKIPQLGIVQIDSNVEIGSNVSIDRARFGKTWIKEGTKIDNLVMIAHNVVIGKHCFIVAQVGIAGSAQIGDMSQLAGQAGISGHVQVGAESTIGGKTVVISDLPDKSVVCGYPAVPLKEYFRNQAALRKVPDLLRKVRDLEKRLDEKD